MRLFPLLGACLLAACAPKEPAGTLHFTTEGGSRPSLTVKDLQRGDSVPFKLGAGDLEFTVVAPPNTSMDLLNGCAPKLELIPYGKQQGQMVYQESRMLFFDTRRLNGLKEGVYFFRLDAAASFCRPTLILRQ